MYNHMYIYIYISDIWNSPKTPSHYSHYRYSATCPSAPRHSIFNDMLLQPRSVSTSQENQCTNCYVFLTWTGHAGPRRATPGHAGAQRNLCQVFLTDFYKLEPILGRPQ